MSDLIIRELNGSEAPQATALAIEVWLHTYGVNGIEPDQARYVLDNISEQSMAEMIHSPHHKVFGAFEGKGLAALLVLDGSSVCPSDNELRWEIHKLYVKDQFKGRGLGRRFLQVAEEVCGSDGGYWLTVYHGNASAIAFYKAMHLALWGETYFNLQGKLNLNYIYALKTKV
ncbi:GNAT family N-acetyltransferase [Rhodobacteraceae bacterium RKSG542]|uniref:GNAT family N-acetyltransferase n=1 Tax=Pseudovibrio flavus TaxID=2529854 RepID=UPI0012BC7985|nr:GNAT family N-acetyltransferase [Pseudovibrio flavus]MTI18921.1 GNAT family N-acetyltransferase [Pseudovibrio flavus]